MTRWDYKRETFDIATIHESSFETKLAMLGNDGWELTTTIEHERHGHTREVYFVFRRPIAD